MICKVYAEASNKLLKPYNAKKPTSYIIYLDANNLYGHSMDTLVCVDPTDFSLDNYSNDSSIDC